MKYFRKWIKATVEGKSLQISKKVAIDRLSKMSTSDINQIQEEIKLRGLMEWEQFTESEHYSQSLENCVSECRKESLGPLWYKMYYFDKVSKKLFGKDSYENLKKQSKAKILCKNCVKLVPLKKFNSHSTDDSFLKSNLLNYYKRN